MKPAPWPPIFTVPALADALPLPVNVVEEQFRLGRTIFVGPEVLPYLRTVLPGERGRLYTVDPEGEVVPWRGPDPRSRAPHF